jgi:AcrR family transcriptional regulator
VGRPPGPTRDKAERRAELLDAATEVIRQRGPDASMNELAAAAGITKPILYSHFGDKAGLVTALADRAVEELNQTLAVGLATGGTARDRMRATIDAFVGYIEREPQMYRFLVRGALGSDTGVDELELVARIANQITVVLGAALRAAGADSGPAELWAYAIVGAAFFGAEWWLSRPVLARTALVDDLTRILWDGLGSSFMNRPPSGGGR